MSDQDSGWAGVLVNLVDSVNRLESGMQSLKTPQEYKNKISDVTTQLDVLKKSLSEAAVMSGEITRTQKVISSQAGNLTQDLKQASILRKQEDDKYFQILQLSNLKSALGFLGFIFFVFCAGTVFGRWGINPEVFRMNFDTEKSCTRFGGEWFNTNQYKRTCVIRNSSAVEHSNLDETTK